MLRELNVNEMESVSGGTGCNVDDLVASGMSQSQAQFMCAEINQREDFTRSYFTLKGSAGTGSLTRGSRIGTSNGSAGHAY